MLLRFASATDNLALLSQPVHQPFSVLRLSAKPRVRTCLSTHSSPTLLRITNGVSQMYLFRDESLKLSGSSDSRHLTLAWIEIYSYSRIAQQQKSSFSVGFLCRTCPFCGEPWKRSCCVENCTTRVAIPLVSERQTPKNELPSYPNNCN